MKLIIEKYKCLENVELPLEGFVTVTGGYGSGRTTLAEAMFDAVFHGDLGSRLDNEAMDCVPSNPQTGFILWWEWSEMIARGKFGRDSTPSTTDVLIAEVEKRRPDLSSLARSILVGDDLSFSKFAATVASRISLQNNRANSLRERLKPANLRMYEITEKEMENARSGHQQALKAIQDKIDAKTKEAGELSKDPDSRDDMLALFKEIDSLRMDKAKVREKMRGISSEHQRRRLIADGGQEDLEEMEDQLKKLNDLQDLILSDDVRYAQGRGMKGEMEDARENLRLLGLGDLAVRPDGSYDVNGRPATSLSSAERFLFSLAMAAAKLKAHGWPWLFVDCPVPDMPMTLAPKLSEDFKAVIWMVPEVGKALTISPHLGSAVQT